jgi:polar amino acid transport system substrate-binding protein
MITVASCMAMDKNEFIYLTEEAPPQNFTKDGELKGIAVDILKAMWERMGFKPGKIKVIPWSQGYQQALSQANTVIFSTSRLEEREKLFKWVGPIRTPRLGLIAKKRNHINITSLEDVKKYRIVTVSDDASEMLLLNRKVPLKSLTRVASLKIAIQKLKEGSVDIIAYGEENVWYYFREHGIDTKQYEKLHTISGASDFYAFHKDTPDATIKKFQDAFVTLKKDGSYDKVLIKYGTAQ